MSAIEALLRPRRIAVIGASADAGKMTGRPVAYLLKHGFAGEIYPVNPRADEIAGLRCYPDVASLPDVPDVGIVLLGADRVVEAVAALAARGTKAAIVLASGFGEGDAEGKARQEALNRAAGGMRILGPNTIGLVNVTDRITLSATGALEAEGLAAGHIGVISQSGGILGSLLSRAVDRGIGFSKLVATGNEGDLDTSDMLEALVEDEATHVIAIYMEGLRRPDAFRRAALAARGKGKPVVVFKVGRSEVGAKAAVSHTGALAGEDRVYDAYFRQLGIIRATNFSDLLDIPAALATGRRADGRRIAVLTSTGGAATLIADSCGVAGFTFPEPDAATGHALVEEAQVDAIAAAHNPIDVTLAGLKPDLFRASIRTLMQSACYDALVVVIGSSALAQPDIVAQALLDGQSSSDKPLLAYVSPHAPDILRRLNLAGIPAVAQPESCSTILHALQRLKHAPLAVAQEAPDGLPGVSKSGGQLDEVESKALFGRFGVPVVQEWAVPDAAAAEQVARTIAGPIVLKLRDSRIAHKSELGGVRVGLLAEDVAQACVTMAGNVADHGFGQPEGYLVQPLVRGGIEMILGLRRDAQLGTMILLGMGGVTAELLRDNACRLLPITRDDARSMIDELIMAPLLRGYRGADLRDEEALIEAIMAFARMGDAAAASLSEAEINPLFVMPAGQGVMAVDGLVVLNPVTSNTERD